MKDGYGEVANGELMRTLWAGREEGLFFLIGIGTASFLPEFPWFWSDIVIPCGVNNGNGWVFTIMMMVHGCLWGLSGDEQ